MQKVKTDFSSHLIEMLSTGSLNPTYYASSDRKPNRYSLKMNIFFYLRTEEAGNFWIWFQICRIQFCGQIFVMPWFISLPQLNVTYESSCFNTNNSSTIKKDMKNSVHKDELYWSDDPIDKISATSTER